VTINEIFRGVMPYLALIVIAMAMLYIFRRSACGCRP